MGFKHSLYSDIFQFQVESKSTIALYNLEYNTLFNNFLVLFVLFYLLCY